MSGHETVLSLCAQRVSCQCSSPHFQLVHLALISDQLLPSLERQSPDGSGTETLWLLAPSWLYFLPWVVLIRHPLHFCFSAY